MISKLELQRPQGPGETLSPVLPSLFTVSTRAVPSLNVSSIFFHLVFIFNIIIHFSWLKKSLNRIGNCECFVWKCTSMQVANRFGKYICYAWLFLLNKELFFSCDSWSLSLSISKCVLPSVYFWSGTLKSSWLQRVVLQVAPRGGQLVTDTLLRECGGLALSAFNARWLSCGTTVGLAVLLRDAAPSRAGKAGERELQRPWDCTEFYRCAAGIRNLGHRRGRAECSARDRPSGDVCLIHN